MIVVQVSAAVALVATLFGFLMTIARGRAGGKVAVMRARQPPTPGLTVLWIIGTLSAIFWPLAFFVVPAYAYHWPPFADFPFYWAVQVIGVGLGVSGGVLYSRSARALGRQMTPFIRLRSGVQLVQVGPYRFVRHPLYTAIILITVGQALLFLSLPAAVLALLLAALAVYRARLEERMLGSTEGFGSRYLTYAARTGRFLPRIG